MHAPAFFRRLACLIYESLLLLAVLVVAYFPWGGLLLAFGLAEVKWLTWVYWWLVAGLYFSWFWRRGQTLAMKTWRIRLVAADGGPVRYAMAVKRYLLACLLNPVGWLWALFARDGQFLHDRLAGTQLVNVDKQ